MIISVQYGKGAINVDLPDGNVIAILRSADFKPVINEAEAIRNSLNTPIGDDPLSLAASRKSRITVVVSDYTRATPNKILLPPVIDAIKKAGRRADELKILVAYGLHKSASEDELKEFLGGETLEEVEVINHDAEDEKSIIYLGETSFRTPVYVNRLIVESDLVVLTGLIEPHFFAGYSGGRKAILPGVAGKESIFHNHSFKMIMHPLSRYGVLSGNPVHEDMVEAAKMIKQTYLVNVVIDRNHKITGVFAGDIFKAHLEGVKFLDAHVKVKSPSRADIVITSNGGYPLDRDLYQAVKGMATGELIVRRGGVIVIFAECIDGIGRGHENFYQLIAETKNPEETLERIRREEPIKDQWEAQILAQILKKTNVILVTKNIKHSLIEEMHMIPASNSEEALEEAYRLAGRNSRIAVVPEGPYVIPAVEN
ncbi:MAG: nickel-dependent lactate racemase [Candidatus Bathyarchaeia archaeon]|nr:nickel-dependent lactate racemase [Candidatus Bathyarchaeota archaeon]